MAIFVAVASIRSGTSGMKVCCNGGINLSILDGWWVEAYAQDNGWAIGAGEEYTDLAYQDEVESRAIYDLLEQEIVPLFYNRSSDGIPRGWLNVMKRSMSTVCPSFNTNRMVQEYNDGLAVSFVIQIKIGSLDQVNDLEVGFDFSMAIQRRHSFSATAPVVFDPAKRSRTMSPSPVSRLIKNSGRAAGK